jgi:hypothetical protein
MKVFVTALIGAYLIIRGLSFFWGGYPNEAKFFEQVINGKVNFPGSIFLYFLLFIALNIAGNYV